MIFFEEELTEAFTSNCTCDTYGCQDGAGNDCGCDNDNEGTSITE